MFFYIIHTVQKKQTNLAAVMLSSQTLVNYVCMQRTCVSVCAESCQQECVKQAAGLLSLPVSYLGVQIQAGALLVCEGSGEGRCFKTVTVSYPQTPHCTALY